MPLDWYTPSNLGEMFTGGDSTPTYDNTYDQLFSSAGDQWETARKYGYNGAMPTDMSGEAYAPQQGDPKKELFDWMKQSGYQYGVAPGFSGSQANSWFSPSGSQIQGTQRNFEAPDDNAFFTLASMAMSPFGGLGAGGAYGGLGGTLSSGAGAAAINGAAGGAFGALGSGGDLKDAARGAAAGGLAGGYTPDVAGYTGLGNGVVGQAVNGAARGGLQSLLGGGNVGQGAAIGGTVAGLNSLGDNMDFYDLPGSGTAYDSLGESTATLGGNYPSYGVTPMMERTQQQHSLQPQEESPWGSQALGDFASSIMGKIGGGKGLGDIASGLLGMYSGYRRRNAAADLMGRIGGNRDSYLSNLRGQLGARDAARGRRSNIGGREVELQAKLAELDSRNAPALAQLSDARFGGLEQMMASGLRMGNKFGWFGDQGGGYASPQTSGPGLSMPNAQLPNQAGAFDYSLDPSRRYRLGGR